ncbi:hypothetical protein Afe04nite_78170 [Asanoa ferruginea]|nr:hypothetical protein Afe04nite_78170 [Asanoa ferruginea]
MAAGAAYLVTDRDAAAALARVGALKWQATPIGDPPRRGGGVDPRGALKWRLASPIRHPPPGADGVDSRGAWPSGGWRRPLVIRRDAAVAIARNEWRRAPLIGELPQGGGGVYPRGGR